MAELGKSNVVSLFVHGARLLLYLTHLRQDRRWVVQDAVQGSHLLMRVICLNGVQVQVMGCHFLFLNDIADVSQNYFTILLLFPGQYLKKDLFAFMGIILETHVMILFWWILNQIHNW